MLLIDSTSTVSIVTSAAGAIQAGACWVDNVSGTITPGFIILASIGTATTTTLVASPVSGIRNITHIIVKNDNALTNVVQIQWATGANAVEVVDVTLQFEESFTFAEGSLQVFSAGGLLKGEAASAQVNTQVFAVNGTWTKPTGFTPTTGLVKLWGAGGGGGAGASLATLVVAKGGVGGGGGAYAELHFMQTDVGSSVAITVGTGGAAGTPGIAGALGGDGGVGSPSSFGTLLSAYGGGGGRGGCRRHRHGHPLDQPRRHAGRRAAGDGHAQSGGPRHRNRPGRRLVREGRRPHRGAAGGDGVRDRHKDLGMS